MFKRMFALSPFLILAVGLFLFALVYSFIHVETSDGWWIIFLMIYAGIAVLIGLADVVMKFFIHSQKTLIIVQLVIAAIAGIVYLSGRVTQSFVIPENYDKQYVTIIFNVADEEKIPFRYNPFQKPIEIPENGYFLTSSKPSSHQTTSHDAYTLKYPNGDKVYQKGSSFGYSTFHVYHFKYNGKEYPYLTFKLQPKEKCCGYSGKEMMEHKETVKAFFSECRKHSTE